MPLRKRRGGTHLLFLKRRHEMGEVPELTEIGRRRGNIRLPRRCVTQMRLLQRFGNCQIKTFPGVKTDRTLTTVKTLSDFGRLRLGLAGDANAAGLRDIYRNAGPRDRLGDRVGFVLVNGARCSLSSASPLLHNVREFMRQQLFARTGAGRELPRVKNHIFADGVSVGIHSPRRFDCRRVDVHPHATKVITEALFHEAEGRRIKRLTGRVQDFSRDRRRCDQTRFGHAALNVI